MTVSIITPVYNSAHCLIRCLNSVTNQSYKDLEVILIDDGSTDESGSMCDEYALRDNRIKVIHQQNQGASLSRKKAVELSTGEYILFVDSDDWIGSSMVEQMVSKAMAEKLDIVWCDLKLHAKRGNRVSKIAYNSNSSIMLDSLFKGIIPGWFCNKLISSNIIKKLTFPQESMMEDIYLTTQVLLERPRMGYIAEPFYNYNKTNQKALTNANNCIIDGIPNVVNCYHYLLQKQKFECFKNSLSILILKEKIALLNDNQFSRAQDLLPFAHKQIDNYPIKFPLSIIYWIALNWKHCGPMLFSIFKVIRKTCAS